MPPLKLYVFLWERHPAAMKSWWESASTRGKVDFLQGGAARSSSHLNGWSIGTGDSNPGDYYYSQNRRAGKDPWKEF
jgi:hypothetical protein